MKESVFYPNTPLPLLLQQNIPFLRWRPVELLVTNTSMRLSCWWLCNALLWAFGYSWNKKDSLIAKFFTVFFGWSSAFRSTFIVTGSRARTGSPSAISGSRAGAMFVTATPMPITRPGSGPGARPTTAIPVSWPRPGARTTTAISVSWPGSGSSSSILPVLSLSGRVT